MSVVYVGNYKNTIWQYKYLWVLNQLTLRSVATFLALALPYSKILDPPLGAVL